MPTPTRDEIKPKVIAKLKAITDEDDLAEKENSDLARDLGMSAILKWWGHPLKGTVSRKKYSSSPF